MINGTPDTVEAAIAEGDAFLAGIASEAKAIRADLAAVPFVTERRCRSPRLARGPSAVRALVPVPAATDGLDAAWCRLTVGAAAAGRLSAQLAEHDRLVGEAAEQGRAAKYKTAIKTLDEAAAAIAESRKLRDRIVASVDVTVLDQWLDRNAAYDEALPGCTRRSRRSAARSPTRSARRSTPRRPRGHACHPTRAVSSSSWPRSAGAG